MANEQLYIPAKLKVGFQEREGTYTGKLAYVIYFDDKGVLRKEKSWEGWRDKKITPVEIDNVPMEGFVLNKNVGGYKSDWNYRSAHIRVYDPRDFEFEVDLPNLLFILKECDCSRGKGLEGKFVYAWDGKELVLLPVGCEDYKKSKNFTELQSKAVKGKELIPGASYTTKKQETLIYLGRFDYHWLTSARYYSYRSDKKLFKAQVAKRYVFWNPEVCQYSKKVKGFEYLDALKTIACLNSDQVVDNYAELVADYHKSVHGTKVVKLFLKEVKPKKDEEDRESWYVEDKGEYIAYNTSREWGGEKKVNYVQATNKFYMKDGLIHDESCGGTAYPPGTARPRSYSYYGSSSERDATCDWHEPNHQRLFVELESGAKFRMEYSLLSKD